MKVRVILLPISYLMYLLSRLYQSVYNLDYVEYLYFNFGDVWDSFYPA